MPIELNFISMTNEQLIAYLSAAYPSAEIKQGIQYPEITIDFASYHALAIELKSNSLLAFDYLICQSGVDYPNYIQIVNHLESTTHKHVIVLKTNTKNRDNAIIDTVCDIWPTAEFHEREIFDLLGVSFANHPDLRRLFLDENWGFPLRKDYQDDIHIVER